MRDRQVRLCHLIASMQLEENYPHKRSVPSSFTLLRAEFGLVGNRQQVLAAAYEAVTDGSYT